MKTTIVNYCCVRIAGITCSTRDKQLADPRKLKILDEIRSKVYKGLTWYIKKNEKIYPYTSREKVR